MAHRDLILSILGSIIAVGAYFSYIWSIVRGQTRPHRVTWGVWAIAGILGLWASLDGGAGIGLLVTTTLVAFIAVIFLLSLVPKYGKPGGEPSDKWVGLAAIVAIIVWRIVHFSPSIAATIAIVADASVLWLTMREAWRQPETEALWPWVAGAVAEALGVLTLGHYNYAAAAYTVYILIGNLLIIDILLIRRPGKAKQKV